MSGCPIIWQWNFASEKSRLPAVNILGLLFEEATGNWRADPNIYVPNQFSYFKFRQKALPRFARWDSLMFLLAGIVCSKNQGDAVDGTE